jgi:hypothetical protein
LLFVIIECTLGHVKQKFCIQRDDVAQATGRHGAGLQLVIAPTGRSATAASAFLEENEFGQNGRERKGITDETVGQQANPPAESGICQN